MALQTGSAHTRLAVLRGNSGSGKSSVARALRLAVGYNMAWVEQDYLRRILLREHDVPGGLNIALIEQTARFALDHSYHVVLEGILYSGHYDEMLSRLGQAHRGQTAFYYFDLTWEETVRRHATRPQAQEFSPSDMQGWYRPRDLLPGGLEQIVPPESTLEQTVSRLLQHLDLPAGVTPGPPPSAPR